MNLWTALRVAECERPCVLTLVGAGGKSTLMARLTQEASTSDRRVLLTTTTRLWKRQFEAFPHHAFVRSEAEALARVKRGPFPLALARRALPGVKGEGDKVLGLPPEWIDKLAREGEVDFIVVEADGSRERPLKAPGPDEPVVPRSTRLFLLLAGWEGVGRPLDARHVHRPERFARLARSAMGVPISLQMLSRVLLHPEGGLKGKPPQARGLLMLNQVDNEQASRAAASLAKRVLNAGKEHVSEVLIAALKQADPVHEVYGRVGAVILAAGGASRFGAAKQIALWRGKPLIAHVLQAVADAEVDEIVVVLGAYRQQVAPVVKLWQEKLRIRQPLRIVINRAWQQGQSTSVRAGLRALGPVHAAIFPLADQPRIPTRLLNTLIEHHRRTLAPIVVPRYGGETPGAPVLFDKRLFPLLAQLQGDTGGRALIRQHAQEVHWVSWPDVSPAWDVDRPLDLEES